VSSLGAHSEVGKLRKVMVHRPGLELQRLTPANHDDLLFDDVLWVERAQWEHDQFVARMRERGVEVFLLVDLLGEALASEEARTRLIELVASEHTVGWSLVDEIRAMLADLKPDDLARQLVGGLTVAEADLDPAELAQVSLIGAAMGGDTSTFVLPPCPTRCSRGTRRAGCTAA
jgi:arginine deiminase